jgi:reactive intermediate/imine deaminase
MAGRAIQPSSSPVPRGHYSPGYQAGGWLFVSGQLPIAPGVKPDPALPFEEQTRIVLANVRTVVEAAGGKLADVARVTVYLVDVRLWGEFNAIYAEVFGTHRPARCVVPVPELHYGLMLEVEATAWLG